MIKKILQDREFQDKPPVLVDVGASGQIHQAWKEIAAFSVCVGFDADLRATDFIVSEDKGFKKLYILNKLIGERESIEPFYLTESPYCSSTLEPDIDALKPYNFSHLFRVKNKVELPIVDLKTALSSLGFAYVDWCKTDSQGKDLSVFKGLGEELISKVIVAEFEPGIMDAYKGEDKMHAIMAFMDSRRFWLCDLKLRGPVRVSKDNLQKYFGKLVQEKIESVHAGMPFWGEMLYLSDMTDRPSRRDILFACVSAIIHEQYGFCIELAQKGKASYGDGIFDEIIQYAVNKINDNVPFSLKRDFYFREFKKFVKRLLRRQ